MTYAPTVWHDNAAPAIDAAKLNGIEAQLVTLDQRTATLRDRAADLLSRLAPDHYDPFATLSTDAPTISYGTSATLTARIAGPQTGEITEVGSRGTWDAASGRLPVSGQSGLGFYYFGTACEIHLFTSTSGALPIWVWVNGKPVTAAPDLASVSSVTSSTEYYVKLTWGASMRRRVEFFCPAASWYDVRGSVTDSFMEAPQGPVVAWVGDSFYAGSSPSPALRTSCLIASRMLGVECVTQNLSYGGTGYVATGAFNTFGSAGRTTAAATVDPDLVVFQGSLNDDSNFATVQAAATATYAAFAAACPSVPFIVIGPQPSNATNTLSANRASNVAAVQAAAAAASQVVAFHDQVGTVGGVPAVWNAGATYAPGDLVTYKGSVWKWSAGSASGNATGPGVNKRWDLITWAMWGTGRVGSTAGDGNRDVLLYSDDIHPTPDASEAYGLITAKLIRRDLIAAAA